ncbi:hypothetical protein ACFC0X_24945 [Paenibacillus chitinolyticus]|uniref:hypothetical protein n=1 Tax=Paenibacillus chitinolyticus TaxID=79263 RepID=UPI0035D7C844
MDKLKAQLEKIQSDLASERQRGALADTGKIYELELEENHVMNEIQKAEHEQYVQQQAEEIEKFVLPFDYNDIFSNAKANETIDAVVKQALYQQNEKHVDEIAALKERNRTEQQAADERESQLRRQNEELQNINKQDRDQIIRLENDLQQKRIELQDIQAKRDAVYRELDGAQKELAEIKDENERLNHQLSESKRSEVRVQSINVNEHLAKLADEAKQAKIKSSVEIAMEGSTFRGKITPSIILPQTEQVFSFRPSDNTPDVEANVEQGTFAESQVGESFQVQPLPAIRPEVVEGELVGEAQGKDTPVTRAELEERLQQFATQFAAEHGLVKGQVA